jgi:4-amino-4-deoxy-L-arabinose transferase-like glycosyltransferase
VRAASQTYAGWFGAFCLALAAFVYLDNTGSEHATTNPDENLYLQIARLTAASGHWLPLQASETKHRNTKPPALFWQGIAGTAWGAHWELWRLRLPNALFSVATAAMAFFMARKLAGTFSAGAVAALAYLAFLGVYRHGRVFLTTAPETFWLFLPFFVLVMLPEPRLAWRTSAAFGFILGIGALYKSFAMIIPAAGALVWWTLHARGYQPAGWLKTDAPKLFLTSCLALATFSLWFLLDPQRQFIFSDFVFKENVGKFHADDLGYLATALWGKHSVWQYGAGWLTNAGLLAPPLVAVFFSAWKNRRNLATGERLLWIWIITLFVFHLFPNLRYERYLLPAMPAVAVMFGLYWERIPRWTLGITVAVSLLASLGLLAGAMLLARSLPGMEAYTPADWTLLAIICAICAAGLLRRDWIRPLAIPSVFLVALAFTVFLRPFDGPIGSFDEDAVASARGRKVIVAAHFMGRDEIYRFLLPGADMQRVKVKDLPGALADPGNETFILATPLDAPPQVPGFRTLGRRLDLLDYFTGEQIADMLRGNIARHLFGWDLLVDRGASAPH